MDKYEQAVRWIASEDNPGDDQGIHELVGYLTVNMVADLFGREAMRVAKDVHSVRHPPQCERCGDTLNPFKVVWLELNCTNGAWRGPNGKPFPEEESQGAFPFGRACANRQLAESRAEQVRRSQAKRREVKGA